MIQIKHKITKKVIFESKAKNLSETSLREADLCGADLYRANLCEADLCEADLREAKIKTAQKNELIKVLKIKIEE